MPVHRSPGRGSGSGSAPAVASAVIATERLELRPMAAGDAPSFHRILTSAAVRRFLLDDGIVSRAWVEEEIRRSRARFDAGSGGLWGLRTHADGPLLGFAGYRPFFNPPQLQLLYGLDPAHWRHGLATEAARAVIDYGFERLGFRRIAAATDPPNRASVAVLERLDMRLERTAVEDGRETLFYGLDHPDPAARSRRRR